MERRPLTDIERAELQGALTARNPRTVLVSNIPICLLSAIFAGLVTAFLVAFAINLAKPYGLTAPEHLWIFSGIFITVVVILSAVNRSVQNYRNLTAYQNKLRSDLHANLVETEATQLKSIIRLREEEHFTEMLLLVTTDHRVRALLDDSTTNTIGDRPKRSRLRIAQEMHVSRYPISGRQVTTFSGATLRRPNAMLSNPRDWPPEEDAWLNESQVTRLFNKLGIVITD